MQNKKGNFQLVLTGKTHKIWPENYILKVYVALWKFNFSE